MYWRGGVVENTSIVKQPGNVNNRDWEQSHEKDCNIY